MCTKRAFTGIIIVAVFNLIFIDPAYTQPEGKPGNKKNKKEYSVEQAISDRAQLNTIAFDGLAFITGTYGADLFFPPGKVADYFGFQYIRDNDSNEMGHNTSFLSRIAENILSILTDEQKNELESLARNQEQQYIAFAEKRFVIIKAFRRKLENYSRNLNRDSVIKQFELLYAIDADLSYQRAEVMGKIIRSFTAEQKEYLSRLSFLNSLTWPEKEYMKRDRKRLPHLQDVAVMTYASEMFSWYKGNLVSDVYFCPERHGTYFGGFYLKDSPAINNSGYNISTSLTGETGEDFMRILNSSQKNLLTDLVDKQRDVLKKVVSLREEISKELRKFISGNRPDRSVVADMVKNYGRLDGELSLSYAEAFAEINRTVTANQRSEMVSLRGSDILPEGGFLYSDPVDLPDPDCDFLFR